MYSSHSFTGAPFTVYFYGEFSSAPDAVQTFTGANTDPMPRYQNLANGGVTEPVYGNASKVTSGPMNDRLGAVFSWNANAESQINSRVGVSTMSVNKARSYIQSEIPSWNVNDTAAEAVKEWNDDVFSKMQVPLDNTANLTNIRLLYSSLYFIHLMPSDRTGENPLWQSDEPFWDDFYTLCELQYYYFMLFVFADLI
jgi:putative alpha-1,2-mannosidase